MSDQLLLAIGVIVFGVTVWATLAFGYWRFGRWYDRDVGREVLRRRSSPAGNRPADAVSHDRPDLAADAATRAAATDADRSPAEAAASPTGADGG